MGINLTRENHSVAPLGHFDEEKIEVLSSVSELDLFFADPDPGFFAQSGSGSRQQKTNFSKAKSKILGEIFVFIQKVGILFLFTTNQVPVGILLSGELLFGIIFKNK